MQKIEIDGWEVFAFSPELGRVMLTKREGDQIRWKIQYFVDGLVKQNKSCFNESAGKKWGDGQIVARVPLNIFYNDLQPALEQGDKKTLKKWLNDSDNRDFRTFDGSI